MKSKVQKIGQWAFVLISFALVLYRVTLHADVGDEITNLNISYRFALGGKPFYEIKEAYQLGDYFLTPFLWLFIKITGSTDGIILFSRFLYIAILCVSAFLTYKMFSRYIDKTTAFFIGYVIVFFQVYSLFYIWYDTAAIIFFLLGDLAVVNALENSKGRLKRYLFLALGGLCHSCMVIAHVSLIPMAILMAVLIVILILKYYAKKTSAAVFCVFAYTFVPLMAIVIGLPVAHAVMGLDNLFSMLIGLLSTRSHIDFDVIGIAGEVVTTYFTVNKAFIPISIILLIVYLLTWKWKKLYLILAAGIILLPILNQLTLEESIVKGLANYISYIALWAPFLYGKIRKKRRFDRCLFYVFWIPILFSAVLIPVLSYTGERGPVKSWQMFLPGALATLYYMMKVWKQTYGNNDLEIKHVLLMAVSVVLLCNSYTYNFFNAPLIEASDKRIEEGIYKGIKVKPEMLYMEKIQKMVERYSEGCESVLASGDIKSIYLMTDLKPLGVMTEKFTYAGDEISEWDAQLGYCAGLNEWPAVIFATPEDLNDPDGWALLNAYYKEMVVADVGDYRITIFRRWDRVPQNN